jgi:HK97 family phage prohead protease
MPNETYLTFSAAVTAADTETRTIKGLVVPFGKVGNTSAGKVVFELGSINQPDPSAVKFLLQHDPARPIGRAAAFDVVPSGIMGSFKVSSTTAGNDALVEASDGLRDGLSVGASVHTFEMKEGVMHVTSASIDEVSLVHAAAFTDAKVTEVAASENEPLETETATQTQTQEGETMSEENATTEVEAAEATVTAAAPAYTSVRSPIISDGTYLEHSIKAAYGNEDSRQYVRAADDAMTNNTGVNRPSTQQRFIDSQIGLTSAIDAIGRTALIANGMTFETPRFTANPTVAETAEGAAPSETGITGDFIVNTVKKASGLQRMSFELLDRSSPQFYEAMVQKLQKAAAKNADEAVLAALTAAGTVATGVAASAAGLISYCATEGTAALVGTGEFANALIASPAHWAAIQGYTDTTGRPLFNSFGATSNAVGQASSRSLRGVVQDLDLYVDPFFSTAGIVDDSAFIITPDAVKYYESPSRLLQVNQLGSGEVEVNLYHYYSVTVEKPLGVRRFNLT